VRVLQVAGDQAVPDRGDRLQRLFRLGDDLPPTLPRRVPHVDLDHPAAGRVQVALETEERTVVAREEIRGVEVREEVHDR
jgi:hypothetical protein